MISDFEINTLKKTNFIDITDEVRNSINFGILSGPLHLALDYILRMKSEIQ